MALNRTGIAEVIAQEGFGRLWRRPEALRGAPRREQLPRTGVIDFEPVFRSKPLGVPRKRDSPPGRERVAGGRRRRWPVGA